MQDCKDHSADPEPARSQRPTRARGNGFSVHPDLLELALRYPQGFLIPIEHLTHRGLTAGFADALDAANRVDRRWVLTFNRAFAQYWRRAEALHANAPDTWKPPRRENLWIISDRERARPYHQPFPDASWTLDAGDFDPRCSNVEFGTYMLLHAERLTDANDVAKAVVGGMSYWATRSDAESQEFCAASETVPRLDARAFQRLAKAMPWARMLFHRRLRPAPEAMRTSLKSVPDGALLVPVTVGAELERLIVDVRQAADETTRDYRKAIANADLQRGRTTPSALSRWLTETRPRLLLTDGEQRVVWDPEDSREVTALETALDGASAAAVDSIVADLAIISDRSTAFLRSLRYPKLLPRSCRHVESARGLSVNPKRRLVAYSLRQPGRDPLQEPAPAYDRLLVGARTIHEWGHLAQAAGWVGIPAALRREAAAAKTRIRAAIKAIIAAAPPRQRDAALALAASYDETPGGLAVVEIERHMPDYLSTLLATHFLPTAELETYARAKIRTPVRTDEEHSLVTQLITHALQCQSLQFTTVDDPLRYCLDGTSLSAAILDSGVVQRTDLEELFHATGQLCACARVVDSAFFPPYNRPPR